MFPMAKAKIAYFTQWVSVAVMSDHPIAESLLPTRPKIRFNCFFPLNLNESDIHEMQLHKENRNMRYTATSATLSGVEPVITAPPEASPKRTGLSHEREQQPASPEKKEVYHMIKINSRM